MTQSLTCVLSASICLDFVLTTPAFICLRWTNSTASAISKNSYLVSIIVIRRFLDPRLSLTRKTISSIRMRRLLPITSGRRLRVRATCNSNLIDSRPDRPCPTFRSSQISIIGAYSDLAMTRNYSSWLSASMRSHQKSLWFWARIRHQDSVASNLPIAFNFALHHSNQVAWTAPAASLRASFGSACATFRDHPCLPSWRAIGFSSSSLPSTPPSQYSSPAVKVHPATPFADPAANSFNTVNSSWTSVYLQQQ